jgi:hypothetical protein
MKAPERDRDRDLGYVNPARWRKQNDIANPEYLTGVVYDHRTKANGMTMWKVRFRNAPGGMQDFEMMEEDCKITAKDDDYC